METVRVSTKGQVVIPKRIREKLRLTPGARLEIRVVDGEVVLRPGGRAALEELFGCAKGEPLLEDLKREHAEELCRDDGLRFLGDSGAVAG